MIHLGKDEKILMVLHRHWIVIFGRFLVGILLLILPAVLSAAAAVFGFDLALASPYLEFFGVIYLMIIMAALFMFWMDYYLDIWIITSERIVDIEQKSLFNREVSEFMLDKVQDITVEVPGMVATFLKYGNLIIQTAGEQSFSVRQVPHFYEAKNLIMDYARRNTNQRIASE